MSSNDPFFTAFALYLRTHSAVVAGWQVKAEAWNEMKLKRELEQRPAQVVGGAPHGFGVWIDGEFHRVDIGALGTVIVRLTAELAAARKELVEQHQATQSRQQTSEFSPSAIWHVGYNLFMEDRTKGGEE